MELNNNLQLFAVNDYCESMYGENPLSDAVKEMLSHNNPSDVDLDVCSDILSKMCKEHGNLQMFTENILDTMKINNDAQILALAEAFDSTIGENEFSNDVINLLHSGLGKPDYNAPMFDLDAFAEHLNEYAFWDVLSGKSDFRDVAENILANAELQKGQISDIKELVEKLTNNNPELQKEQPSREKEYSPYQQKIMEKINREMNQSQDKDKSQDMDR